MNTTNARFINFSLVSFYISFFLGFCIVINALIVYRVFEWKIFGIFFITKLKIFFLIFFADSILGRKLEREKGHKA